CHKFWGSRNPTASRCYPPTRPALHRCHIRSSCSSVCRPAHGDFDAWSSRRSSKWGARRAIVFHTEIRYSPDMNAPFAQFSSLLFFLSSLTGLAAADAPFAGGRWIDLTHEFSSETLYWPTAESFALETEFHGQTPKGYFYAAN